MPDTAADVYIKQFTADILMAANITYSKARPWCDVRSQAGGPGFGQAVAFDVMGRLSFEPKIGRGVATPRMDPQHARRWAYPAPYSVGVPIEDFDITQMSSDPTNKYTLAVGQAAAVRYDTTILAAAIADTITGVAGASSEDWSAYTDRNGTSHVVAVGGAGTTTGFNLEKFLLAKRVLAECDVEQDLVLFYSPQALEDAFLIEEFGSSLYNLYKAIYDGTITQYGGVTWVQSTHLPKSSTTRSCVLMQRGALGFVSSLDKVRVGENPAASYEKQVYAEVACGACRKDAERVFEIQITEA